MDTLQWRLWSIPKLTNVYCSTKKDVPMAWDEKEFKIIGEKNISEVTQMPCWWNLMCRGNRWGCADAGSRVTAHGAAQSNSTRSTSQHARAGRWVTELLSSHLENWKPALLSNSFFPAPVKDDLIPCVHGWEQCWASLSSCREWPSQAWKFLGLMVEAWDLLRGVFWHVWVLREKIPAVFGAGKEHLQ